MEGEKSRGGVGPHFPPRKGNCCMLWCKRLWGVFGCCHEMVDWFKAVRSAWKCLEGRATQIWRKARKQVDSISHSLSFFLWFFHFDASVLSRDLQAIFSPAFYCDYNPSFYVFMIDQNIIYKCNQFCSRVNQNYFRLLIMVNIKNSCKFVLFYVKLSFPFNLGLTPQTAGIVFLFKEH